MNDRTRALHAAAGARSERRPDARLTTASLVVVVLACAFLALLVGCGRDKLAASAPAEPREARRAMPTVALDETDGLASAVPEPPASSSAAERAAASSEPGGRSAATAPAWTAKLAVAARFAVGDEARVFPTEGGAYVRGPSAEGRMRVAYSGHDGTVTPVPVDGLPKLGPEDVWSGIDGRWPHRAWVAITHANHTCAVFRWQGARWVGVDRVVSGECEGVRAWTNAAAIAVVRQDDRFFQLRAFGQAPQKMLRLADGGTPHCPTSLNQVTGLAAFETGEVAAVGPACHGGELWVEHWASGSRSSVSTGIDTFATGGAFLAAFPASDQIRLFGSKPAPRGTVRPSVMVRLQRVAQGIEAAAVEPSPVGDVQGLVYQGPAGLVRPATVDAEGFELVGVALGENEVLYVVGTSTDVRGPTGQLVYASHPVTSPFDVSRR